MIIPILECRCGSHTGEVRESGEEKLIYCTECGRFLYTAERSRSGTA